MRLDVKFFTTFTINFKKRSFLFFLFFYFFTVVKKLKNYVLALASVRLCRTCAFLKIRRGCLVLETPPLISMSQQGFRDTQVNMWEGLAHENYQIFHHSIIHIPGILKWTVAPD